MFYDNKVMNSSSLKNAWRAGTKQELCPEDVPLPKVCRVLDSWIASDYQDPGRRMSLRASSILVNGAAKLYKQGLNDLIEDMFKIEYQMSTRNRRCTETEQRMAQEIRDEIKRLQRRKQLRFAMGAAASCSSSSGSEGDCSPPHSSAHADHKMHNRPVFTFKQVRMFCQRMLREQEAALRAGDKAALRSKAAEQCEAFVRFNLDQVQRQPPPTCMPHSMDAEHHMH